MIAVTALLLFLLVSAAPTLVSADGDDKSLVQCSQELDRRTGEFVEECDFDELVALIRRVINYLIIIAVPVSAAVFAYAGIKYMTAAGDTGKMAEARRIFTKVILGFVVMLSAWLVVFAITSALLEDSSYSLLK